MLDNRRYYSLDALRGVMMMLGIVLHGSQWYLVNPPGGIPLPLDPSRSYVFDVLVHFIHSFRMPLFFVLAGFFTSLLVGKRGFKGTYLNRVQRILIPLVLAAITILPLTMVAMVSFMTSARFDIAHQFLGTEEQIRRIMQEVEAAGMPMNEPSLGHLWFLYYLLYFYLLIPVCFLLNRWSTKFNVGPVLKSPLFFVVLSAYAALTLLPYRGAALFEGFIFIKPHLPSLIYYGSFFVLGYLFHGHRDILDTFRKYWVPFAILSVVLMPLSMWMTDLDLSHPGEGWRIYAAIVNGTLTWALIYAFTGGFLRFLDLDSPWVVYISNSSYWVYLLHMPVIVFAAWLLLPYALPAEIKFLLAASFTTVVCFVTYHYLVQNTWIGERLSGKRFTQPWPWLEDKKMATGDVQ